MKKFLIGLILFLLIIKCKSQSTMKVIYVYDALCGWCYGFSPVISQFHAKYKDSLAFEVVSGGMIVEKRIGPIGEVASYINTAYKVVEKTANVKFGAEFLNKTLKNGKAIFTSIPPSIAMSVFKKFQQENSIQFASALQKAIYYDGIEPENYAAYGQIVKKFGLDSADFVLQMRDPLYMQSTEVDFKKSIELGVLGFPTVFLEIDNVYHKIASGYISFDDLENNYLTIKNNNK